jgi:hypothetical protein
VLLVVALFNFFVVEALTAAVGPLTTVASSRFYPACICANLIADRNDAVSFHPLIASHLYWNQMLLVVRVVE